MTRVTGQRMSLKLLAGVRPCSLGSGPKVKSQATVLWRQTQGAALWDMTRGLRLERDGGQASHGVGLVPYSVFCGEKKKVGFALLIGKL